jgi:hypothetical protein
MLKLDPVSTKNLVLDTASAAKNSRPLLGGESPGLTALTEPRPASFPARLVGFLSVSHVEIAEG